MDDQTFINGLSAKLIEPTNLNAELRERVAAVANDIKAVKRVLDSLGYRGQSVGQMPRAARIVLFYRNKLREYLLSELRKANRPLTTRDLRGRTGRTRWIPTWPHTFARISPRPESIGIASSSKALAFERWSRVATRSSE